MTEETPQYLAARIQQRLAEDERAGELGIRVDVRSDTVFLRGEVATEQRRRIAEQVAAEVISGRSGRRICNELSVTEVSEPTGEETLS